jgi:Ca-activated chloride channel family protein
MVIDRSSSMSAEMEFAGERTTRLDAVKAVFAAFLLGDGEALSGRPNDLVGMTAFARHAETVCPLTLDHAALEKFLGSIHIVTRRADDGTAIGDAVALAAARLRQAEETLRRQTGGTGSDYTIKSKVLILLTDGQNNAGKRSPEEAAALAAEWGIKIYAIGVGAGASSATVRTPLGRYRVPMGSPMDEATLEGMAEATGGLYLRADDAEGLRKVYETIDRLERTEIESLRHLDYRERFVPLALAALAMLALELLLRTTLLRTAP